MRHTWAIVKRELAAYFATPIAFVFISIFVALAGALTFYVGGFFERNQASLDIFFSYHPWLYLLLVPAVAMRSWAEERRSGTIEQLLTLPVTTAEAVLGKFIAGWLFCGIALALSLPMWICVNYLGHPDNGAIAAAFGGSFLLTGALLAIGMCVSALTRNQVIAFVTAALIGLAFMVSGVDTVLGLLREHLPSALVGALTSFSFLPRFESMTHGIIEIRDVVFSFPLSHSGCLHARPRSTDC